jgi:hemerythrin
MVSSSTLKREVPAVDQQHWLLADCISSIEKAVSNEGRSSAVNSALDRLADFFRMHCEDEERLMRIHNYPELEEHAEEHRELLSYVAKLKNTAFSSEDSLSMMVFIQNWLHEHTRTSDRRFSAYLSESGN